VAERLLLILILVWPTALAGGSVSVQAGAAQAAAGAVECCPLCDPAVCACGCAADGVPERAPADPAPDRVAPDREPRVAESFGRLLDAVAHPLLRELPRLHGDGVRAASAAPAPACLCRWVT